MNKIDELVGGGLLGISEVSEALSVHPNTVRMWCNEGILKAYRIGTRGDRRIKVSELESFLNDGHRVVLDKSKVVNILRRKHCVKSMTPALVKIVSLISEGKTNKEIAKCIGRSEQTVKNHITNLLRVLGAKDRAEAVAICYKNGTLKIIEK